MNVEEVKRSIIAAGKQAYDSHLVSAAGGNISMRLGDRYFITATNPPSCFIPQPKVTSSVIRLKTRSAPPVEVKDKALFFRVVRAAFGMRRKTLTNALSANFNELTKADIENLLTACGFDSKIRGEVLPIGDFAAISDAIFDIINKPEALTAQP